MGLIRAFERIFALPPTEGEAQLLTAERGQDDRCQPGKPNGGVALFMVVAAISILSILATEFTYVAQVNQKMAYDSLDQVKAHYLAKSGLKLSLLRLKAYSQVKAFLGSSQGGGNGGAGGGAPGVPKQLIEQIWAFPFVYPLPKGIPGMSLIDQGRIAEFEKNSSLQGNFTARIMSESAKYNLNRILQPFAPPPPSPSPGVSPSLTPSGTPSGTPNVAPSFSPEEARKTLSDYLGNILNNKFESDPDFASEYRDFRLEDLMDGIVGWADRSYERRLPGDRLTMAFKRAPFNSVSELHMVPPMGDELFDLLTPSLTVSTTPGININTMQDGTLKALVPGITKEEIADFFKFRDSPDEDNLFKNEDEFFKYLLNSISVFRRDQATVDRYKNELQRKGLRLITDESEFKIIIEAKVNQSVRTIEAWVTLKATDKTQGGNAGDGNRPPPPGGAPNPSSRPDSGLKITFMRIL